jgi:ParB family transcriptional regulator, chromosome partitioning protein
MVKNKSLGMGLAALMGGQNPQVRRDFISPPIINIDKDVLPQEIEIDNLKRGKYQPRTIFNQSKLAELADSIKESGVISPILVRKVDDFYEIIAGERRWRAAKLAGLSKIPVIVQNVTDKKALEVAIIENVQRQDLSPIEEAEGLERLIEEFKYTHEELAKAIGKSRSHVSNMIRLLKLPAVIRSLVNEQKLSMGHARAIISSDQDPMELVDVILAENLSVRQTENLVRDGSLPASGVFKKNNKAKVSEIVELEQSLTKKLAMKVSINYQQEFGGKLMIEFASIKQLDTLIKLLNNNVI